MQRAVGRAIDVQVEAGAGSLQKAINAASAAQPEDHAAKAPIVGGITGTRDRLPSLLVRFPGYDEDGEVRKKLNAQTASAMKLLDDALEDSENARSGVV